MLTFDEIEGCMPDGAHAAIDDDGNETGFTFVSAQWLHDFAHRVAAAEREACKADCRQVARDWAKYGPLAVIETAALACCEAIDERSNV